VGNPVSCAAALAVFRVLEEEGLLERARTLGRRILEAFTALQQDCPLVGEVRGLGAMVGVELVTDRTSRTPAPRHTEFVLRRAAERGVLALRAGVHRNVVRLLPPLVLEEAELQEALDGLAASLREAASLPA
jgi:4-aminobutyrate aminotransferase/(S)-3-amino-2-methylpropionate transaminase